MNEEMVLRIIDKKNWHHFNNFMQGQTVGINADKSTEYYECDVKSFLRTIGCNETEIKHRFLRRGNAV